MTPLTYPLPEASSSLTTIHNIIISSDPTLRILRHTHGIPISSGLENGNAGSVGGYDYQRQTFTFGGTQYGSTTFRNRFLFGFIWEGLFQLRPGTIDNRAQRISDHNRCLTQVITTATMAMTSVLSPAVTFRWRYYSSFFLLLPNVDFHTGQQQRFLNP